MPTIKEPQKTISATAENGNVRREEYIAPEVNIFETKDGYVLEADMPGVNKQGLEITLQDNEITIVGHRASDEIPGQPIFHERRQLDYRRVFQLDPVIDSGKISAKMNQGVLTLTLPKSEKVRPRKIHVDD